MFLLYSLLGFKDRQLVGLSACARVLRVPAVALAMAMDELGGMATIIAMLITLIVIAAAVMLAPEFRSTEKGGFVFGPKVKVWCVFFSHQTDLDATLC